MKMKILPFNELRKMAQIGAVLIVLSVPSFATSLGQELLTNGSFESSTPVEGAATSAVVNFDSWTFDVPDDARNGKQNLKTEKNNVFEGDLSAKILSNGSKGIINQMVSVVDTTQTYLFSVYLKPNTESYNNVVFNLKAKAYQGTVGKGTIKKVVYNSYTIEEGYVRYGFPVMFNEVYDAIDIQIVCNQARDASNAKIVGEFLIDNANVIPITEFVNMDFEEGIDYVWRKTLKHGATITNEKTNVYEGAYAANLNLTANVDTATLKNQIRVPITPGMDYTITTMAKTLIDHGNADSLKIVTRTFDADHDLVNLSGTRYDVTDAFDSYSHVVSAGATEKYMSFDIEVWNQAGSYIVDNITIDKTISTAINDVKNDDDLIIYPNPASDYITIDYKEENPASLKIYDTTGKLVLSKENMKAQEQVDIQALSNGIHIIELMSEDKVYISKLVKR